MALVLSQAKPATFAEPTAKTSMGEVSNLSVM